jgi:predicted lipoprotein with Yx(FWY)xxD motif
MRFRISATAIVAFMAVVVAACSSAGASTAPSVAASVAPPPSAAAASSGAPSAAGSGNTVEAKSVGSVGTVLVAGSNGMTVYTFTKDTKGSGTSACTGACIQKWPALTVTAGSKPVAGSGVTGTLATITRPDDGSLQVTYNGLPLYFFSGDSAAGDANGVYTNWEAVKP